MSVETCEPLIFLDIDGVLNNHDYSEHCESTTIHRGKVMLLNEILFMTGAKIVLSSAWRYLINRNEMTLKGVDWLMRSHGLRAGVIIGITHPDTPVEWDEATGEPTRFMKNERALQVSRWRAKHGHVGRYVVIDDLDLGFTVAGHPFVQTEDAVGICKKQVEAAIMILNGGQRQ